MIVELELTLRTLLIALLGREVLAVVFLTSVMKASSVSPEEGALIALTMPTNAV